MVGGLTRQTCSCLAIRNGRRSINYFLPTDAEHLEKFSTIFLPTVLRRVCFCLALPLHRKSFPLSVSMNWQFKHLGKFVEVFCHQILVSAGQKAIRLLSLHPQSPFRPMLQHELWYHSVTSPTLWPAKRTLLTPTIQENIPWTWTKINATKMHYPSC